MTRSVEICSNLQICTTLQNANVQLRNFTARYSIQVWCKIANYSIFLPEMLISASYAYSLHR